MKTLKRIRVRETHGIRRYLYPLRVQVPPSLLTNRKAPWEELRVAELDGTLLPSQAGTACYTHLDFALSLAPLEERTLLLVRTAEAPIIPDPLEILPPAAPRFGAYRDGFLTRQERFSLRISPHGWLDSVVYDGMEHLAGALQITLNNQAASSKIADDTLAPPDLQGAYYPMGTLSAAVETHGLYKSLLPTRVAAETRYDLTACKSWVQITHKVSHTQPHMVVRFTLPLRVQGEHQFCDFGVGAGVYARVAGKRLAWTINFDKTPFARWEIDQTIGSQERLDYQGEVKTAKEFAGQAWFHWVDGAKSLAVALTRVPKGCQRLMVRIGSDGMIDLRYELGPEPANPAEFGVCYHFLNNVPAIAAATNPQSILLPPTVEVLPV